jgi:hypothetical protein
MKRTHSSLQLWWHDGPLMRSLHAAARTVAVRSCCLLAGALALVPEPASADPEVIFLSGEQLLTAPNVSFPGTAPTLEQTALVLGPATARSSLIEVAYPAGGNWSEVGAPTAVVNWQLTRLSCDISGPGCNDDGGAAGVDHDPIFYLRQGNRAYAYMVADNDHGTIVAGSFEFQGNTSNAWAEASVRATNTNFFPTIGQRYNIDLAFVMYPDHVAATMNFVLIGRPDIRSYAYSFTNFGGFDPAKPYSVGILHDDNPGERYMLNSAGIAAVPEVPAGASISAGLAMLALALRSRR